MPRNLTYETLEKLTVGKPVDRLSFMVELCRDKVVLDVGCLDETAMIKRDTEHWLHGRIGTVAKRVIGVDNSAQIPPEGLVTGANSVITRGNGINPTFDERDRQNVELVIAGEFIEHIDFPLEFVRNIRDGFPGRELVISTPNGTSFANTLLGIIGREVQHRDHVHVFTYKILNTLCMRSGISDWEIIPYRFYATEMLLQSRGVKRAFVRMVEASIRLVERVFPLLSFGYIVRMRL